MFNILLIQAYSISYTSKCIIDSGILQFSFITIHSQSSICLLTNDHCFFHFGSFGGRYPFLTLSLAICRSALITYSTCSYIMINCMTLLTKCNF